MLPLFKNPISLSQPLTEYEKQEFPQFRNPKILESQKEEFALQQLIGYIKGLYDVYSNPLNLWVLYSNDPFKLHKLYTHPSLSNEFQMRFRQAWKVKGEKWQEQWQEIKDKICDGLSTTCHASRDEKLMKKLTEKIFGLVYESLHFIFRKFKSTSTKS